MGGRLLERGEWAERLLRGLITTVPNVCVFAALGSTYAIEAASNAAIARTSTNTKYCYVNADPDTSVQ